MYDFYPEWGPARHRDDDQPPTRRPRYWGGAGRAATVARDTDSDRPDDN